MPHSIPKILTDTFPKISLEEMGKVKLMNRIDTKFVTTLDKILCLLSKTNSGYMMQEIDGETVMPYYTVYFDTSDNDMFYQHQRGKKQRQKVRKRLYEGSMDTPFLEIKRKNNKGRTKKKRVGMDEGEELQFYDNFLKENSYYNSETLEPKISNHFYRITLVNNDMSERITIDTDIEFKNLKTGEIRSIGNVGIIEWKRDGNLNNSGLERIIRDLRIKESGFSKYCIGMALTDGSLRCNRLKPKLRNVLKLI